jgi:hypothetical protein
MRYFIFALTILFLAASSPLQKKELTDNKHVTIELSSPKQINYLRPVIINFQLSPNEGIHVNSKPEFEFVIDKTSPFEFVAEEATFKTNDKGYVDASAPIQYVIKPKLNTKPGKYSLKGKFNYFFCSDKEGWCNRHSQSIELPLQVVK